MLVGCIKKYSTLHNPYSKIFEKIDLSTNVFQCQCRYYLTKTKCIASPFIRDFIRSKKAKLDLHLSTI